MGEVVPIAGILAGTLITVAAIWGGVRLAHGPLGQALAQRLRGRSGDAELSGEVVELRQQVDLLRRQIEETQERMDFAERLLSQRPPPVGIPGSPEQA